VGLRVMVGVALGRMVAEGDGLAVALGIGVTVLVGTGVEGSTGKDIVGVGLAQADRRLIDKNTSSRVFTIGEFFDIIDHYICVYGVGAGLFPTRLLPSTIT